MEVQKTNSLFYEVGKVASSVEEFKFKYSINELLTQVDKDVLELTILEITGKYLNANIKGRSILDTFTTNLLIDHIITECGNLELQEIEFIFKNGIKGKFGTIYNDISLDTICGADGWIEKYYFDFRKKRETPIQEIDKSFDNKYCMKVDTGLRDKENRILYKREWVEGKGKMTIDQYLKNNPEQRQIHEVSELLLKAKTFKLELDDVKRFYEIKELDKTKDLQDDMEVYSRKYFNLDEDIRNSITELKYILMEFSKFVILNWNKVK